MIVFINKESIIWIWFGVWLCNDIFNDNNWMISYNENIDVNFFNEMRCRLFFGIFSIMILEDYGSWWLG